jgi:radical SAM protein with 4Fe4S-binding SPASM domain
MPILSRFAGHSSRNLIPTQVTLELTYKCNERCGHCYLSTYDDLEDGRPPLTLDEWKKVLDQFAEAGSLFLVLIGGEAMMHPYFWEISEYAAKKNFAVSLITNALLVDEKAAKRMAEIGFYYVTVSLYSLKPEIHDKMTHRKGSHQRTLAGIHYLRQNGVMVGINCLLTGENIDHYFELEDWANAHSLQIKFDPMVTPKSDASLEPTATRASSEQLKRFYQELKNKGRGPQPQPHDEAEMNDPVCNAGRGKAAVNVYGDLLTCLEVRDEIGNLKNDTLENLWFSKKAEFLRSYKVSDLKFESSCGDGAFCDHCPGMAGAETGDRMSPVPFLMDLAKIKREVFEENG